MNFDLHCHSNASDGELPPAAVARRAAANGVELWSLTDHDVLAGLDEAGEAAREAGMRFVPGVEISVTWRGQLIHIVGLGIDAKNATLLQGVRETRGGREVRAERIAQQLETVGITGALEGAHSFADDPASIGRAHFARYLLATGHVRTMSEAFDRFLGPGQVGYVPREWASLTDAVSWIRGAGGVAVIAHPGRYDISRSALTAFIEEFKAAGGIGMEVVTGSHSPDQFIDFGILARHHGLLASRGSDFHGVKESRFDLGKLPDLAPELPSIVSALPGY